MHILIIGAAGMVGRKLTERLAKDGTLAGKRDRPSSTLHRRRRADSARRRRLPGRRRAPSTSPTPGVAERLVAGAAGPHLPSRGDRLGRGRGRFREGLPDQSRRHALPVRGDPQGRRRLQAARRLHLVDRRVRRAVPRGDRRRVLHDAAHLLRHAEGDRRAAARRLYAARLLRRRRHPPADHLRAARQAEQGGIGLLLRHHPRAAGRPGGGAAGRRRRSATGMPARARRSTSCPCGRAWTAPRSGRAATSPCRASRRPSASRSRRCAASPATRSSRASAASPTRPSSDRRRLAAPLRRAARDGAGLSSETNFDEIVRIHIEDELGGTFAK